MPELSLMAQTFYGTTWYRSDKDVYYVISRAMETNHEVRQNHGIILQIVGRGIVDMHRPGSHWWNLVPDTIYFICVTRQEAESHGLVIAAMQYDHDENLWHTIHQDPQPYFATVMTLETLGINTNRGIKE